MTDHERNLYRQRIEDLEQIVEGQAAYMMDLQGAVSGWLSFQGDLAEVLHGNRILWKGGAAEIQMVKNSIQRVSLLEDDLEMSHDMIDTYVKTVGMLVRAKEDYTSPEEDYAELQKAFQKVADEEAEAEAVE